MNGPLRFGVGSLAGSAGAVLRQTDGSAILEFAIVLPLLVVFIAGIYDFGGAFNQKQKVEQAAQEGAIVAGAQPTSDLLPVATSVSNPDSLVPVVYAVFNSLQQSGVLTAACTAPGTPTGPSGPSPTLTWQYTITGCSNYNSSDNLVITINRGFVAATSTTQLDVVGTVVTVSFPYDWRFYSVIQQILPGVIKTSPIVESATVHNQM
ncbi:MAG: TadE/TadG family type IV pilus assembly protein [Terriglobales bacterium]